MPYANREIQLEAQRSHYWNNKPDYIERLRRRRTERRRWFDETILAGLKCERCPESDPCCLDFHHRDPAGKEGTVSQLLNEFRSQKAILNEIAKCIVICANCHRKEHARLRGWSGRDDSNIRPPHSKCGALPD